MCVVVGAAGSRDGHRCSGQRIGAHTGVDPDEGDAQGDRCSLRVKVSRHDSTQAYQEAAMGCHAIEAVEVWVARFGAEVGSMVGTAAWQRQDGMAPAGFVVE